MIKKAKYATKVNNSNAAEVQRLNTRVDELLRDRDVLVTALEFFADGNNWMREAACDPNSGNFRGTKVAFDALATLGAKP